MRRVGPSSRITRVALAAAGGALAVLVLAQVLLPRIAAGRISSRLRPYGGVQSVSVSAWPAVKLLWGSADSVTVKARVLTLTPAQTAKLLWEARDVSNLDVTAEGAREGPLRLSDISLRKRGSALSARALASEAAVTASLPGGFAVQLLESGAGTVRVRAGGGLFGVGASVEAVAGASDGRLVVRPVGLLLEGLQLTLFADPHVYVEGVAANALPAPGGGQRYSLSMTAALR